jgi:hypothetical protein
MSVPIRSPKITNAKINFCRIVAITLYVLLATTAAFAQFTAGLQGNIREMAESISRTLK